MAEGKESCARIVLRQGGRLYVLGHWRPAHFMLEATDGDSAWLCAPPESDIQERAQDWGFDSTQEYVRDVICRYLIQQDDSSAYAFSPGKGDKMKLSWELQRGSLRLTAHLEFEPVADRGAVIRGILDMLIDENVKLDESLQRTSKAFERMKDEADRCLKQSESFMKEKNAIEADLYKKFVAVLNAKKAKLRELRQSQTRAVPTEPVSPEFEASGSEGESDWDGDKEEDDCQPPVKEESLSSEKRQTGRAGSSEVPEWQSLKEEDSKQAGGESSEAGPSSGPVEHTMAREAESTQNRSTVEPSSVVQSQGNSAQNTTHMVAAMLDSSGYVSVPRKRRL